ncbi:MAG: YceI family protein [bacterium]|nr:YceI family protein [bacterium]
MKKLILLSLLLFPLSLHAEIFTLDPGQSQLEWVGKKVTGQHNGLIKVKSGTLNFDGKEITGGEFEIDMTTIEVLDLKDPKSNAKLTNHLKSGDFFSIQEFPTARFTITRVEEEKGSNKIEVTGNLTLKGITHPITIPAVLTQNGNTLAAKGQVKLDRTQWNVRYGSGKFFDGLGDKLIYDDFLLKLNLIAKKQLM